MIDDQKVIWDDDPNVTWDEEPKVSKKKSGGFLSGLWEAVNPAPLIKTAGRAMSYDNPVMGLQKEFAEPMGEASGANIEKAVNAPGILEKLKYGAQAIPMVGPAIEKEATLINDKDYSGAAGFLAGLALPAGASKVAGMTSLPAKLRTAAETQYSRVLNPTKNVTKAYTAKVVPGLIERGVMAGTFKGLRAKVSENIDMASDRLDTVWDEQLAGKTLDKQPIVGAMNDVIKEWTTTGEQTVKQPVKDIYGATVGTEAVTEKIPVYPRKEIVDALKGIRSTIEKYGDDIPSETLKKTRQVWDAVVAKAGGYGNEDLITQAANYARREGANAIRSSLNKNVDLAAANKELSYWLRVNDVLEATALRRQGQAIPMSEQLLTMGGFAHGGIGMGVAAKEAAKLVRSVGWNTVSAVTKNRLARMLESGRITDFNAMVTGLLNAMPEGEEQ
jgi:hypothetical protein